MTTKAFCINSAQLIGNEFSCWTIVISDTSLLKCEMIKIFGVLKGILLLLGISYHNERGIKLDRARNFLVCSILGSWAIFLMTGVFYSDDIFVIVQCFILCMNSFTPLVLYSYIWLFKAKLFKLTDEFEITLNEREKIYDNWIMTKFKNTWYFSRNYWFSNGGKFERNKRPHQ